MRSGCPSISRNRVCVVHISHTNYRIKTAGIEKYISDINEVLNRHDISNIQIFPVQQVNKLISRFYLGINVDGIFVGVFDGKYLDEVIVDIGDKYSLDIRGFEIHQLTGWSLSILSTVINLLQVPVNIFVHDYEMICKNMLSDDGNGSQCRSHITAPNTLKCSDCKYMNSSITRYKEVCGFLDSISAHVSKVIAPSDSAKTNWLNVFGQRMNRVVVRPHMDFRGRYCPAHTGKLRLAYIGSIKDHKGYKQWQELSNEVKNKFDLYYFGNANIDDRSVHCIRVDYRDANSLSMVDQLRNHEIDLVFLWSTCQETYCYTAYEAYSAGCIILTNSDSGNIASLVKKQNTGFIFSSIKECIEFLRSDAVSRSAINHMSAEVSFPEKLVVNDEIDSLLFTGINGQIAMEYQPTIHVRHKVKSMSFIYKMAKERLYQ